MEVEELAKRSNRIVLGQVLSKKSMWNESGARIFTEAKIKVGETIHGQPLKTVKVRRLGGVVGRIGQLVTGTVRFKPGEQVLLFLEDRGDHHIVVGMRQGKFRLVTDKKTRARLALKNLTGLTLAKRERGGARMIATPFMKAKLSLKGILARINKALGKKR